MKRKFYFLFMCLMAVQYSMAQSEPESLLSADKIWIMCYKPVGPMYEGQNSYDELMLGNERIIDGITFRQILRLGFWQLCSPSCF